MHIVHVETGTALTTSLPPHHGLQPAQEITESRAIGNLLQLGRESGEVLRVGAGLHCRRGEGHLLGQSESRTVRTG